MKMRVGGPKAAKRPRPERATYPLTLNTLRFECRCIEELQRAQKLFDRLRIGVALKSVTARVAPQSQSRAKANRQSSSERATASIARMNRRKSPPNRPYSTASNARNVTPAVVHPTLAHSPGQVAFQRLAT